MNEELELSVLLLMFLLVITALNDGKERDTAVL